MKNKKISLNPQKVNKKGALLPFVALGILAVAGLVPFLTENTDTNAKLTQNYDEANKITWAIESAAQEKLKIENVNSIYKGLGNSTTYKETKGDVVFNYGSDSSKPSFQAIGEVSQYNSFLNKNFCILANGTSSRTDNTINLRNLSCGYVKPGVATINNTTYAWDKNGKLYEIDSNNELKAISNISGKVWQVVAGKNSNPAILTTGLEAYYITPNSSSSEIDNKVKNLYQIANAGIGDSFGITIQNQLASLDGKTIFSGGKVEDLAVGSNHGLFLVAKDENDASKGYDLYGWGNNQSKQINCKSDTAEFSTPVKVECSLSAPTGVYAGSISPMNENQTIEEYFSNTYGYANGKTSACYIENPYNGGEIEYHRGANNDRCTCALCLDIWDLHKNSNISTIVKFSEPQDVKSLQFMIDRDGARGISYNYPRTVTERVWKNGRWSYTYVPVDLYTKCSFIKVDDNGKATGEGFSFISKNNFDNSGSIVSPLGNVYLLDFDNDLSTVYDLSGSNVVSTEGMNIPVGKYTLKVQYAESSQIPSNSDFTTFATDALFWGINPRAITEDELKALKAKSGGMNLSLTQSQVFGQVFRLNQDIFNIRGGIEYDDEVPTYYALAAGDNYSLAIIVRNTDMPTDGSKPTAFHIIGWGDDTYGQLGVGVASGPQKMTILPIGSDIVANYRDLKAGKYHALFLTKDGKVYSWGGSTTKANPHPVDALNSLSDGKFIVSVSAGNDCSSAIDNEGNIYTWTVSNEKPVVIAGGTSFGE